MTYLNDYIKKKISLGFYTGMVLLDLQKAFDTVDHEILCNKLISIGMDFDTVNWFKSYLMNRTQIVEINNTWSDSLPINCGVPQGSILGPLLFLVYM